MKLKLQLPQQQNNRKTDKQQQTNRLREEMKRITYIFKKSI